jgi:VCBS repeat-containing protein
VTKSVIYGLNSSGFSGYVAAKVTSSGSLTTAIGDISGVVGQNTMANSLPVAIASNQSAIPASQSGTWTTGRTWSLLNTTDSVNAVQSGTWTTGRTWTLSSGTDSVAATQSGTWTVQPGNVANTTAWLVTGTGGTFPATQSGTWTVQPGNTANTTPWLTKLNDGTNSFTVKAASTAAVASDTAVVVAVSPNNSVATKSPVNANGSLSANNSVTGTESNIAAPSNAVGVIVQARDANTANVSYGFNNATTAILASGGLQLQPGRDSGFIPVGTGAYLHLISASGTQTVDVQWILSQ